jgi:hypothetical protein
MDIYVKVFFLKIRVASSNKPPPPDEELDLPTKKPKEKPEKENKEKKDKKDKTKSKENKEQLKKELKEKKKKAKLAKKEKKKLERKKKEKFRFRDIFKKGGLKKAIKIFLKFILRMFLSFIKLIGHMFAVIGKVIWGFLSSKLGFLFSKLGGLRFKFKKRVKEPKKSKLTSIHIDIPKMLEMLRNVLGAIFLKLWRYFRVRVKNFHITVASEDAATTAMMYGAVCGFGDEILTILEKALDFKIEKNAKVGASCDFVSEEMKMDVEVDISITVGNVFRYLFGIVGAALAGVLRGIKIRFNKDYFQHREKYKKDIALYNAYKTELEKLEAHKSAKKAEKETKAAEKAAKKAEKAAKKASKKAETAVNNENAADVPDGENNENNDLKTDASERENNYES